MNFWDTSALAVLDTGGTHGDTSGEPSKKAAALLRRFKMPAQSCHEVQPAPRISLLAQRLLRVHPLKAADALQFAAALAVAEDDPASIGFVCLDARPNRAAAREVFQIVGP